MKCSCAEKAAFFSVAEHTAPCCAGGGKFIVLNERIHRFHDLRLFIEVLDWKRHFDPPENWHPIRTSQKGSLARELVQ